MYPNDAFGQTMLSHFDKMSAPIHAIYRYPSLEKQAERLRSLGYECRYGEKDCLAVTDDIVDMNQFYQSILSAQERKAIETLEQFDELEEWHMKCRHYFIAVGFKGARWHPDDSTGFRAGAPFLTRSLQLNGVSRQNQDIWSAIDNLQNFDNYGEAGFSSINLPSVKRWGHSFTKVGDSALIFGGYGVVNADIDCSLPGANDDHVAVWRTR
jgi:hypothetical protein